MASTITRDIICATTRGRDIQYVRRPLRLNPAVIAWRIPKLTAFVTPFELFEFTLLSMGLCNGPSSFSRAMCFMTRDLEDMLVYIDDVNVYGKRPDPSSPNEILYQRHYNSVKQFFERCAENNLRLNGKKCGLGCLRIRFLGNIVSFDDIHPDPEKVAAVATMLPCTTQTEVRAFLGLVGYY